MALGQDADKVRERKTGKAGTWNMSEKKTGTFDFRRKSWTNPGVLSSLRKIPKRREKNATFVAKKC
jgi:hypothetical protein